MNWDEIKASPNVPDVDPKTIIMVQLKQALERLAQRMIKEEVALRG